MLVRAELRKGFLEEKAKLKWKTWSSLGGGVWVFSPLFCMRRKQWHALPLAFSGAVGVVRATVCVPQPACRDWCAACHAEVVGRRELEQSWSGSALQAGCLDQGITCRDVVGRPCPLAEKQ